MLDLLTTIVGSYPVPEWLAAHPSEGTFDQSSFSPLAKAQLARI